MSTIPDPAVTDWVPLAGGADLVYRGAHIPATNYNEGEIVVAADGVAYICVRPTNKTPSSWPSAPIIAPQVKATRATNFALTVTTWQPIPWDGEEFDTDAMHDLAVSPARLTARTAGRYAWSVFCGYALPGGFTFGNGFLSLNVQKNNDATAVTSVGGGFYPLIGGIGPSCGTSGVLTLAAGDYLAVLHYVGGVAANAGNIVQTNSWFTMWRIGG